MGTIYEPILSRVPPDGALFRWKQVASEIDRLQGTAKDELLRSNAALLGEAMGEVVIALREAANAAGRPPRFLPPASEGGGTLCPTNFSRTAVDRRLELASTGVCRVRQGDPSEARFFLRNATSDHTL